ncbi:MAG: hypothetical protein M2R45_02595 [Verrucomicrobia subdivision 3 bacterium]|nr:hypothetical protein [Limisphaerales bacterium]MCS1416435.1 hypothetical protein [Limisphaerales bacterium]
MMSGSTCATIAIAVQGGAGGVKVAGRANVACSVAFRRILEHLREDSVDRIFVFLEDCLLMDSTFLGVLAKQGVAFSSAANSRRSRITLVTPSERVLDLIENLGVLSEFEVAETGPEIDFVFRDVSLELDCDLRELTKMSLEAHETLIELKEENRARFEGVTTLLAKDLGVNPPGDKPSS